MFSDAQLEAMSVEQFHHALAGILALDQRGLLDLSGGLFSNEQLAWLSTEKIEVSIQVLAEGGAADDPAASARTARTSKGSDAG